MLRPAAAIALLALLLAACGSAAQAPHATRHTCPAAQRALAGIQRDIAALRHAAKLPTKSRLDGNHPINVATDRFLKDVALAPIDNLQRNRLIDHAAAALAGNCEQCFQALEAERPIPAISQGDLRCPKA